MGKGFDRLETEVGLRAITLAVFFLCLALAFGFNFASKKHIVATDREAARQARDMVFWGKRVYFDPKGIWYRRLALLCQVLAFTSILWWVILGR